MHCPYGACVAVRPLLWKEKSRLNAMSLLQSMIDWLQEPREDSCVFLHESLQGTEKRGGRRTLDQEHGQETGSVQCHTRDPLCFPGEYLALQSCLLTPSLPLRTH